MDTLLWNPNIIPPTLTTQEPKGIQAELATIRTTVAQAQRVLKSHRISVKTPLTFGLDGKLDHTATQLSALGGFGMWDTRLRHVLAMHQDKKEPLQRALNYWWPKCVRSGKPMRYLGCATVGKWVSAFSLLTQRQLNAHQVGSPFLGSVSPYALPCQVHIHFWLGCSQEGTLPNCFVATDMEDFSMYPPYPEHMADFYRERLAVHCAPNPRADDLIAAQIAATATVGDYALPRGAITDYRFFAEPDPLPKPGEHETFLSREIEGQHPCLQRNSSGDFQLFGVPQSQQCARRYLAANRWPLLHALAPVLALRDTESDIIHQIYGPAFAQVLQTDCYGFVDSSCT